MKFFSVFLSLMHIKNDSNLKYGGNVYKPEFLRSKKYYFVVKIVSGSGTQFTALVT